MISIPTFYFGSKHDFRIRTVTPVLTSTNRISGRTLSEWQPIFAEIKPINSFSTHIQNIVNIGIDLKDIIDIITPPNIRLIVQGNESEPYTQVQYTTNGYTKLYRVLHAGEQRIRFAQHVDHNIYTLVALLKQDEQYFE